MSTYQPKGTSIPLSVVSSGIISNQVCRTRESPQRRWSWSTYSAKHFCTWQSWSAGGRQKGWWDQRIICGRVKRQRRCRSPRWGWFAKGRTARSTSQDEPVIDIRQAHNIHLWTSELQLFQSKNQITRFISSFVTCLHSYFISRLISLLSAFGQCAVSCWVTQFDNAVDYTCLKSFKEHDVIFATC